MSLPYQNRTRNPWRFFESFPAGERALHNPSKRQHGEFLRRLVRTENNGKLRTELLAYGIGQFLPLVSAIRQHLFQSGEAALHLVNDAICTDTVVDIRLMNYHAHRKTKCISHNVFLAPHQFLKHSFLLPLVAVVEDGVAGREVLGQHTPLAACLQHYMLAFMISLRGYLRFLCCESRIFSVTSHCLSVRLFGYWLITLID